MEWQPIETAPKDGSIILLMNPEGHYGLGFIEISEFDGKPRGQASYCGRRYMNTASAYCGGYQPTSCTHWMPLPPLPKD